MSSQSLCGPVKSKRVGLEDQHLREILNYLETHKNAWKEMSVRVQLDMRAMTSLSFSYTNDKVKEHSINVHECSDQLHYWVTISFQPLDPKDGEAKKCQYWVHRKDLFSFVAIYAIECLWTLMDQTAVKTTVLRV